MERAVYKTRVAEDISFSVGEIRSTSNAQAKFVEALVLMDALIHKEGQ